MPVSFELFGMNQKLSKTIVRKAKSKRGPSLITRDEYLRQVKSQTLERKNQYDLDPDCCKQCGNPLSYQDHLRKKQFCNASCRASYCNKGVHRYGCRIHPCLACREQCAGNRKYCSFHCFQQHRYETYIRRWLRGEVSGVVAGIRSGEQVSAFIRKWLFESRGEKCEVCGWVELNKFSGKIPVQIHHVDGNSSNNASSNLQILCPSCHSLTEHFGARNKGNGRKRRYSSASMV